MGDPNLNAAGDGVESGPQKDEGNRCPVCGAIEAEVSWQTASSQSVCSDDDCPVNTWDPAKVDGVRPPFVDRVFEFNQQFDYGEYHDEVDFWLAMLRHQVEEAVEAHNEGDDPHAFREGADAILVAFQFLRSCGKEPPHHYVYERVENAEERGIAEEIVPKYVEWYERVGGPDTCDVSGCEREPVADLIGDGEVDGRRCKGCLEADA